MTLRIPLRALLFILYTAAILGGAFGISYAVFEWREDSPAKAEVTVLEGRVDGLESSVTTLSSDASQRSKPSRPDCGKRISAYVLVWVRLVIDARTMTQGELDAAAAEVNSALTAMTEACS